MWEFMTSWTFFAICAALLVFLLALIPVIIIGVLIWASRKAKREAERTRRD